MSDSALPLVAVTMGDVAGIGPQVVSKAIVAVEGIPTFRPIVIGHPEILKDALQLIGQANRPIVNCCESDLPTLNASHGEILCLNPAADEVLSAPRQQVSAVAGDAAYRYLTAAIRLAETKRVGAIATAPLNKAALHLAGHNFPGHTEILAEQCGVTQFAMMLHLPEEAVTKLRPIVRTATESASDSGSANSGLSIVHVTLHTSIASVPDLLTVDEIQACIELMDGFLQRIDCQRRQIGVAALNPHGGESGLFGDEESRLIQTAITSAQLPSVTGPLPVDTLVRRCFAGEFDGMVAMYHDQGHIPVKLLGFDSAINITLGLPLVRTSPTHGTAFDKAWQPNATVDAAGMLSAIRMAAQLATTDASAR